MMRQDENVEDEKKVANDEAYDLSAICNILSELDDSISDKSQEQSLRSSMGIGKKDTNLDDLMNIKEALQACLLFVTHAQDHANKIVEKIMINAEQNPTEENITHAIEAVCMVESLDNGRVQATQANQTLDNQIAQKIGINANCLFGSSFRVVTPQDLFADKSNKEIKSDFKCKAYGL